MSRQPRNILGVISDLEIPESRLISEKNSGLSLNREFFKTFLLRKRTDRV